VPSTYCSHVYGKQLIADLGSKEAVLVLQRDFRSARLSEREVEMLAYAETIARDASQVTQEHIERLRAVGFSDVQICDIALCACFRCFVGRFFDAVGAGPEPVFLDADANFRTAMTVGR
jgi:alkylhydroperoxidase family enzyme